MEFYITKTIKYNHRLFLLAISAYRKDNRIKLVITIHNGINTINITNDQRIKDLLPCGTNKFYIKKINKRFSTLRFITVLLMRRYNNTMSEKKTWDYVLKKIITTYNQDLIPLRDISIINQQSLYKYKDLVFKKNIKNL
jgi:hypothetical protein